MKQTEKNLNKIAKKHYEWCGKARKAAEAYLREVLEEQENQTIEFDTEFDDENLSVIYDGGNHPEYASNVCSDVYSIFIEKKSNLIFLYIEDSTAYDLDRLNVDDLLYVCEGVQAHLENLKEK